jgi:thiamine biosynthesis lipoprotein
MNLTKHCFLLISLILLTSCDKEIMFEVDGQALGTSYNVNYFSKDKQDFKRQFDSIFDVLNNSISTYVEDSHVSKFNNGEQITLDKHFKTVFSSSMEVYHKTNGYFDPSIGILVNAYGFGPVDYDLEMTEADVDSLMNYVGFDQFELKENSIQTNLNSYFLDFNANGKGYAVDVIANFLKEKGITNFFVEVGGEIVASGYNVEEDQPWTFGIEKPDENNSQRDLSYAIILNEKALATSGNYRKFRTDEATGLKFVHTINPKTGMAEKSNVLSASVVSDDCMTADAYATAFMAMGYDKAKAVIEKESISALLIYADENNEIKSYITSDLEEIITEF